jgi:predicted lipoprotein
MRDRLLGAEGAADRGDVDDRTESGHDDGVGPGSTSSPTSTKWRAEPAPASFRVAAIVALVITAAALGGCRLVATPAAHARGEQSGAGEYDPIAQVRAIWEPKVLPYLKAKAGPLGEVVALARQSPDQAGAKYGYRPKEGNEPWTFVARFSGRIVAADTASRAATISVDTNGDGRIAAIAQIGPAMRGTAIRDALNFVSFNDFKNQIDYAQFGKAFNQYATQEFLSKLPRDALVGRQVTVLGAFTLDSADQPPLVSPVELTLGPPS